MSMPGFPTDASQRTTSTAAYPFVPTQEQSKAKSSAGLSDTSSSITLTVESNSGLREFFEAVGERVSKICRSIYKCLFENRLTLTVQSTVSKSLSSEMDIENEEYVKDTDSAEL